MSTSNKNTADGFAGSVFKYSISTFANIGILGLSMVLTGWFLLPEMLNQIGIFTSWTNTIMTIGILGLDQSLIRFYHEPPQGLSKNGLFRLCFYGSTLALVLGGAVGSLWLSGPIYSALGFSAVGPWVIPVLFVNALFFMTARYFNVLYRMEGNIAVYTTQSILMQFFYKLFYLGGRFALPQDPVLGMILFSVVGLGGFALVFALFRRQVLRPHLPEFTKRAYGLVLPYGLAVAPTAIMITLNASYSNSFLKHQLGGELAGLYTFAFALSNIVTMVQGGFASFWGPYMFENYKTQQERIKKVHNYLNLIIICFFAFLVAVEDILFWVFPKYVEAQPIFSLMMLSAVFTILCETTVYGNAIARRPVYDTIGIGLSFGVNALFLGALVPALGLYGAAVALALANFCMFLFRTFTAQKLYSSIATPFKTLLAILLSFVLAAAGTLFAFAFIPKMLVSLMVMGLCILLYRKEFVRLLVLARDMVFSLFGKA